MKLRRRSVVATILLFSLALGGGWTTYSRGRNERLRRYIIGEWQVMDEPGSGRLCFTNDGKVVENDQVTWGWEIRRGCLFYDMTIPQPGISAIGMEFSIINDDECEARAAALRPPWTLDLGSLSIPLVPRLERKAETRRLQRVPSTTSAPTGNSP